MRAKHLKKKYSAEQAAKTQHTIFGPLRIPRRCSARAQRIETRDWSLIIYTFQIWYATYRDDEERPDNYSPNRDVNYFNLSFAFVSLGSGRAMRTSAVIQKCLLRPRWERRPEGVRKRARTSGEESLETCWLCWCYTIVSSLSNSSVRSLSRPDD